MSETARVDENADALPWAKIAFDLSELAEYVPGTREKLLTDANPEQATWLAGIITERVRSDEANLPAFPGLAVRILRIMQNPDPDLKELVSTIRADAMISAQLLRIANSVFYARGCEVATVHDAAVRLGMKAVANVAIAAATRSIYDEQERQYRECFGAQWQRLSRYSIQCAACARWLSSRLRKGDAEQIFLGGLLHDIGKVVALRALGAMVLDGDTSPDIKLPIIEAALEEVHVGLGSDLSIFWNLPGHVSYLLSEHHQQRPEAAQTNMGLHLVRVASGLYESRTNPLYRGSLEDELFWSAMSLNLTQEQLKDIAKELKKMGTAASAM